MVIAEQRRRLASARVRQFAFRLATIPRSARNFSVAAQFMFPPLGDSPKHVDLADEGGITFFCQRCVSRPLGIGIADVGLFFMQDAVHTGR